MSVFPHSIYSYNQNSSLLFKTRLHSGSTSRISLPSFIFPSECFWVEVPSERLVITGGFDEEIENYTARSICIEISREFSVIDLPSMHCARFDHCACYAEGFVYVVGGSNLNSVNICERISSSGGNWEIIDSCPEQCIGISMIAHGSTQTIYVLGGKNQSTFTQTLCKLSLVTLQWEVMKLKLPSSDFVYGLPCFSLQKDKVIVCITNYVYIFEPSEALFEFYMETYKYITCQGGPSYYENSTLYCSNSRGAAHKLKIGNIEV